jgi:endonuclease YncB( thermonuclease family)
LFSKYYETDKVKNNCVELYNKGDKAINLRGIRLDIYQNGSTQAEYSIPLSGSIEPKGYYLISTDNPENQIIKDKTDLKSDKLQFNGDDAIVLFQGSKVLDALGDYLNGSSSVFGKDFTLIRKLNHYTQAPVYDGYDYIYYVVNSFQFLKNQDFEIKTDADLIPGPGLKEEYKTMGFLKTNPNGSFTFDSLGGTTPAEYRSHVDGDTTRVKIPLLVGSNINSENSIRYYWNQTPESTTQNVNPQAWGYPASNFIKQIVTKITSNDEFLVQSAIGETIVDTYSRYLGLLWLNGECLNYLNVRAGTTQFTGSINDKQGFLDYKEVSYYGWFRNAELRAKKYKWGIWNDELEGQPKGDPMWDYVNRKRISNVEEYYPPLRDELTIF